MEGFETKPEIDKLENFNPHQTTNTFRIVKKPISTKTDSWGALSYRGTSAVLFDSVNYPRRIEAE